MRSSVVPVRPSGVTWSTNSVSNSPRAGCPSPMLRASKLCQSVSTSGPSATWNPSPMNVSSSRSQACVTRWAWPRVGRPANSVRSRRSAAIRSSSAAEPSGGAPIFERRGDGGHGVVDGLAGRLLLVDRIERAEARLELGEFALLAGEPGGQFVDLVEGRRRVDLSESRVAGGGDVGEHVVAFRNVEWRADERNDPGRTQDMAQERMIADVWNAIPRFTRGTKIAATAASRQPTLPARCPSTTVARYGAVMRLDEIGRDRRLAVLAVRRTGRPGPCR